MLRRYFLPLYSPDDGGGGGGAAGAAAAAASAAAAAAAAAAGAAPAWHTGIDADTVGFWQNKGFKVDDPKELASTLTKSYRELERHIGAPPDQIIRLPKKDAPEADIRAFRERLGMPKEAKDYDFTAVKDAAGNPIAQDLADDLRAAAHRAGLTKEAATEMAAATQRRLDAAQARAKTLNDGKLAEETAKLKADWGNDFDFNRLKAMEGARRLGITPEAVELLEKQIGYSAVMNAMRKIGVGTSEDNFIERGGGSGGTPTTASGALSRLNELKADKAWSAKLMAKDTATVREWQTLEAQAAGETPFWMQGNQP